jgi:hypothetical protein
MGKFLTFTLVVFVGFFYYNLYLNHDISVGRGARTNYKNSIGNIVYSNIKTNPMGVITYK